MGFKMMWQNVQLEKDPYKRNSMIKDILLLQPYLSAYYEATKLVIAKQPEYQEFLDKQQEQEQNPQQQLSIKPHKGSNQYTSGNDKNQAQKSASQELPQQQQPIEQEESSTVKKTKEKKNF
jgi:hypothetical protein